MGEAFDPFDNYSDSKESESELEIVEDEGEENESFSVSEQNGSYEDVTLEDADDSEIFYYEENDSSNDDAGNDIINTPKSGDGRFTTINENDENYLYETVVEELTEYDGSYDEEVFAPSVASTDIKSENGDLGFGYLSTSDVDNSAAEGSVKYDADLDAPSEQESSVSSYFSAINDDPRQKHRISRSRPPRKFKTIEELSLHISSISFRHCMDELENSMTRVGDNSIISTRQSPLSRKQLKRAISSSGRRSIRSESSTIDSRWAHSNTRRTLKTKRRGKARTSKSQRTVSDQGISVESTRNKKVEPLRQNGNLRASRRSSKSQQIISDQSTFIESPTNNKKRQSYESEHSPASGKSSKSQQIISDQRPSIESPKRNIEQRSHESEHLIVSRRSSDATSNSQQLQRSKHHELVLASPVSSTTRYSVYENFKADDGRCASIAVLGTTSGTGKSKIVAALCRILANGGTKCAPFKSQSTSRFTSPALLPDLSCRDSLYDSFAITLGKIKADDKTGNSHRSSLHIAPTKEQGYGEIGMAQSTQADACKILPRVQMNPIFFKSEGRNEKDEYMCTMIVMGKQIVQETYKDISNRVPALQSIVLESHLSLSSVTGAEVIVIQGAGSCSELNLMDGDITNLPLVRCLQCPWFLVANDEIGGVFAQVIGTKMCVPKRDWALCAGVIVNKVKSEIKDFVLGLKMLYQMTGKPLYAVPFVEDLDSPNEESIDIERRIAWEKKGHNKDGYQYGAKKAEKERRGKPSVVIVTSPHTTISNDIRPLEQDNRFHLEFRRKRLPKPYPTTTAIIIPGSRLPLLDMKWLQDSGWADLIRMHVAAGGAVLGLCHGYQMLGWKLKGGNKIRQGIGLLPIASTIKSAECKLINPLKGQLYPSGIHVEGFEVSCGFSKVVLSEQNNVAAGLYKGLAPLVAYANGKPEGMRLGRVQGTYLYGILRSEQARIELLVPNQDRKQFRSILHGDTAESYFDKFANHLETSGLDHDKLKEIVFGKNAKQ